MATLVYILLFTLLGSIGGLIGGFLLLLTRDLTYQISRYLAPFAAGILLAVAFVDLLPEASHGAEKLSENIFIWTLVGILLFFVIERFIHWFHHHEKTHEHEKDSLTTVPLIIIGDTVHNFVDGIVIAATFMADISLGVITALAVFAHEVPQEIGDFGLLIHKGLSRLSTVIINVVSALASFAGALITYSLGGWLQAYTPLIVALTAGFFIYIATSDLIPEIHYEKKQSTALLKSAMLILGVIVMWGIISILEENH